MRTPQELHFTTSDGTEIFYRHWPATNPAAAPAEQRTLVLFHRGHEHSGRLQHIVDELDLPGTACFAWDARGHGKTGGQRGHSPSMGTSIRDVEEFMQHLARIHGVSPTNTIVLGQSVGAVLAAAWVHDYAPRLRGLILASPAFKVKLYVPLARTGLTFLRQFRPLFFVNSYVKAKFLTHDPARIASFENDPLITRAIAVNILLELYSTADRIIADARAITVPTQLLVSGADWVVHHAPQHRFFENLGSPLRERHVLPGFYHDTLGEKDRAVAFAKIRAFIDQLYQEPLLVDQTAVQLRQADRHGYTADEHERLKSPLPRFSPKKIFFALTRRGMATLGKLSQGVRLGFQTGFDSGSTLDYVYQNQPRGTSPLGRFFDKCYLGSIGWRGIRQRKIHLEQLIQTAAEQLRREGKPVRLVDVAAGHGRYVLDALGDGAGVEHILLRDYSEENCAQARALIAERGLEKIASAETGDAFAADSLAALSPAPTLAIVSGLFELFPDNKKIMGTLIGLARALPPGGILLYTNQPWHPQLEFIARVLSSHRGGQPWIMRRRTQAEMDALVRAAGFAKQDEWIDGDGIFSVSLARRAEEK